MVKMTLNGKVQQIKVPKCSFDNGKQICKNVESDNKDDFTMSESGSRGFNFWVVDLKTCTATDSFVFDTLLDTHCKHLNGRPFDCEGQSIVANMVKWLNEVSLSGTQALVLGVGEHPGGRGMDRGNTQTALETCDAGLRKIGLKNPNAIVPKQGFVAIIANGAEKSTATRGNEAKFTHKN
mmetsp:Transcript_79951/g.141080  ORF Transcript_79951/g.141080 Transcript_79951/m.141080 type:complete len:180 (-) Transcript_79951:98-637(-)|eukprot:CAMPEP_0197699524 /NCGR_PEP_ID=MMETSP1338-20131121/120734_1 /TAXON_ID=43686 ORGANISM="Pelagodinium beii, Strain RCC1491" /NCGR_SAMPLE_ID=MMETSP1338 /ASSEMBLY_ACC=CAM_ASM_000754 /LENGTH=179 /DNA_ID=CAMNT_0043283019 /DNA_START=308 /DNA_END=847 /DNA_ORIENTATION=+